MDNFYLIELMDLAEAYDRTDDRCNLSPSDRLSLRFRGLNENLGHDNRGDRPTEALLTAAYGQQGVIDRQNIRLLRWQNGALSGVLLANEPGLGSSRTHQPSEIPLRTKPRPELRNE